MPTGIGVLAENRAGKLQQLQTLAEQIVKRFDPRQLSVFKLTAHNDEFRQRRKAKRGFTAPPGHRAQPVAEIADRTRPKVKPCATSAMP